MSEFKLEKIQGEPRITKDGHALFPEDVVKNFHWFQAEVATLKRTYNQLFDAMQKEQKRAEKAEAERDELERKRGCIRELFLDLDEMEQESKEFHELLQKIFDASVLDSSSERLLQERYIEQQIKALEMIDVTYKAHESGGEPISYYAAFLIVREQLRKELD